MADLAKAIGCPVVRLRAAIPEELLAGGTSLAGAVGRTRGLSAESLQSTARHLARRLSTVTSAMSPLRRLSQAQARPQRCGWGLGKLGTAAEAVHRRSRFRRAPHPLCTCTPEWLT